jgi:hypothetical protein
VGSSGSVGSTGAVVGGVWASRYLCNSRAVILSAPVAVKTLVQICAKPFIMKLMYGCLKYGRKGNRELNLDTNLRLCKAALHLKAASQTLLEFVNDDIQSCLSSHSTIHLVTPDKTGEEMKFGILKD